MDNISQPEFVKAFLSRLNGGQKGVLGAVGGGLAGMATPVPGGAVLGAAAGSAIEDRIRRGADHKPEEPEREEKGLIAATPQERAEAFVSRLQGDTTNTTTGVTKRVEQVIDKPAPKRESDAKRAGKDDHGTSRRLQDDADVTEGRQANDEQRRSRR
jgi:hypothetical protein